MACSKMIQVHQFHDDELAPEHREAMEAHLRECAECRQVLAELRSLSSLIASAALADKPAIQTIRLDQCRRTAGDRGVLRLAGWMTATAAAVLIGALLIRNVDRSETSPQPAAMWQTVAVTPPEDIREGENSDLVVARWMADDLSSGNNGDLR